MARRNITIEAMEEEENQSSQKIVKNSKFDEKNYLNVKLEKGENKKELKIRLLPISGEKSSPFQTIHMHTIKVSPEISKSPWKSYVCLSKTDDIDHEVFGHKCPFCELNHEAYDKYTKALNAAKERGVENPSEDPEVVRWKTISLANRPSEFCIVRCIERGHEDEGPKFWKISVRSDGKDPKNMIKKLYHERLQESIDEAKADNGGELPEDFEPNNILDIYNGTDLKITIERIFDKDGKPTDKTSISIVDYGRPKPISNDDDVIDAWIDDEKKWSDVFVVKPYEYLDIIIDGDVPFYDKNAGKWVPKIKREMDNSNDESEKAEKRIAEAEKKAISHVEIEEYDEDDDTPEEMPF